MITENKREEEILNSFLTEYKEITFELMRTVEGEQLDFLEELLARRQSIIQKIQEMNCPSGLFKKIAEEQHLLPLEKNLSDLFNEKRRQIRTQMEKMVSNRSAKRSYTKGFAVDSIYFSKKI